MVSSIANISDASLLFGSPFLGISCLSLQTKQSNIWSFTWIEVSHNDQILSPHGSNFGASSLPSQFWQRNVYLLYTYQETFLKMKKINALIN